MRQGPVFRSLLLATSALVPLGLVSASAGPQGGQVVGGSSTISTQGNTTTITQTTDRSVINWQTYNVGAGEKVQYIQPSASSVSLNRVVGGLGPSTIYGNITANGQVWIINPAGILVGSGAVVNTAGFLATTSDIKNDDFMAGRNQFIIPGRLDASVVNEGTITATNGGFAALVAPGVRNSGTITANLGKVALASGNTFSLDFYGDRLITLGVGDSVAGQVKDVATGQTLDALVKNEGLLKANGGKVELTAVSARQVVDSVINNKGVIEARSIGHRNGMIVLGAQTSKTKVAGAPVQTVKVSGTLNVSGKKKGGTVKVTGENIELASANINASGGTGGGTVMIGGDTGGGNLNSITGSIPQAALSSSPVPTADTVSVDANSKIDVSATESGNGGKAIVWSDLKTVFAGVVLAKGGALSGNGGFVEVSGKQLVYSGQVDTRAANGKGGLLLLDPESVYIDSVYASTLMGNLATTDMVVTTGLGTGVGDITVAAPITWSSTSTLTLQANSNIHINADIAGASGGLTVDAGIAITASAAINVGRFTLQNGSWAQSGTLPAFQAADFRITGGSFLRVAGGDGTSAETAWRIADVYGLQGIGSNPSYFSQYFKLANNIDATGTSGWNSGAGFKPIGNNDQRFTGQFDGQGYTINGLAIASSAANVGLFGYNAGTIRNVGLTNVNINPTGDAQFAGALAGSNAGTITNAYSTGAVGNSLETPFLSGTGAYGGLVGRNDITGSISRSYSTASVHAIGPVSGYTDAGGLVGQNHGSISESYATGAVSGVYSSTAGTYLGGLVGWHIEGSIDKSYATGSVTGNGSHGYLGGLVGVANGGTINKSYSSGAVSFTGDSTITGGLLAVGNANSVTQSYWDMGTSGQSTSAGGTGLTTAAARTQSSYVGWNFDNDWVMINGQTRPFLRSEFSTTIANTHQFQLMGLNSSANYTLANNIDFAADLANPSSMWASGGLTPFTGYSGVFNGQGYTVSNVVVNGPSLLLFNGGTIQNVTLSNFSVTATANNQYLGILTANNAGTISNVHVSGTVSGGSYQGVQAGGMVGLNGYYVFSGNEGLSYVQGTIQNSSANVAVTVGSGNCSSNTSCFSFNSAGGLAAANLGIIANSSASGAVTVGSYSQAGGLVGVNQWWNNTTGPQPIIRDSWASGNVVGTGINSTIGGLVGVNGGSYGFASIAGRIENSRATGNVTANSPVGGSDCSSSSASCQWLTIGGLVGQNQGIVVGTVSPVVGDNAALGSGTYATGNVSVGSAGQAGGLIGSNEGSVDKALAKGAVTGAAGVAGGNSHENRETTLGGFVGQNQGEITNSTATGNVGSAGVAYLQAGGFAGHSGGKIGSSYATGNVVAGNNSSAGGFAADSAASDNDNCNGCTRGVSYNNDGTIGNSTATGSVTVGSVSAAGGFVAFTGNIANSSASGAVTGGNNSLLGGFAAVVPTVMNDRDPIPTLVVIANSHATGAVTSTGSNTWIGGFAAVNAGSISLSSSAGGNVQATSDSVVGGFVGVNVGQLVGVSTLSSQSISVSGSNNIVGGLVGANFGMIFNSTSNGSVSGGSGNTMGSLVGANGNLANVAPGQVKNSPFPIGTIVNSTGTGSVNSGNGSQIGGPVSDSASPQVGTFNLTKMPDPPSIIKGCSDPLCKIFVDPKLIESPTKPDVTKLPDDVFATAVILSLLTTDNKQTQDAIGAALITLPSSAPGTPGQGGTNVNTASTNNGSTGTRTASQTPGAPPPPPPPPPLRPVSGPDGERFSSIPPITENRFIQNEVVLQMGVNIPLADVQRVAQSMGLTIISQQSLDALGRNAFRFSIGNGRSVRDVIRALEANSIVAVAQPNYQYKLSQIATPAAEHKGDPAQYMVEKLQLEQVHRLASGKNVTIAVIDSEADKQHTELQGAISEQFNAIGEAEKAHSHGTAMVGAIASRDRLLGVAPGAKILAVRAFSESQQSAEGTTFNILKSIDWAVSQGARVINMSFAGPRDPALERTLKKAHDQGVVLIAAAGNAGPKSPPLYPGADPSVIAVTATDAVDRGFKMANQGPHVSVASPGVDVLAPAPQEAYQMSTGTSIATAHVSGVVALMLERDPTLTPADVRKILESTATDLGPKGKDTQFGWGLVNPQKALQLVDERKRKLTEAQPAITTASR